MFLEDSRVLPMIVQVIVAKLPQRYNLTWVETLCLNKSHSPIETNEPHYYLKPRLR